MQALELPPGARAAAASIVRKHVLLLQSPPLSENMYFGISLRGYGPGLGRGSQAPRRPGRGGPRHESDLGPGPCRARGFGATRRRAAGPGPSSGAEFRPCSGSGSLPRPGTRSPDSGSARCGSRAGSTAGAGPVVQGPTHASAPGRGTGARGSERELLRYPTRCLSPTGRLQRFRFT